jgi:hypothetical protein
LAEVVEFAEKIHAFDRQHPVSREVAAKHLGFSGLTGSSDRALSALLHFGLAEKAAKGEIRITDLALQIIHPNSRVEKREALREAAFRPELFRELHERYPGEPPSESSLRSHLNRSNFAQAAIGPASRAYLETCHYLQREGAYESDPEPAEVRSESAPQPRQGEPTLMHATAPHQAPPPGPTPPAFAAELALNEPNINIQGQRLVRIDALLDAQGLIELESTIQALKMLIKPPRKAPANPEEPNVDSNDLA